MTRKIPNGGYTYPDYAPTGDHKVAIDAADDADGNADYLEFKIENGAHLTWTQNGTKLRGDVAWPTVPTPYPGPMTEVGTDYAGDTGDPRYALGTHSHPAGDPVIDGAKLYPARIPDPNDRGMVVCAFIGPHTAGTNTPMLEGWAVLSPGVLEAPTAGQLPSAWLDGVDPTPSSMGATSTLTGALVYVYYQGDTSLSGVEEPLQGIYIIEDTGFHWEPYLDTYVGVSTKARLRRAPGYTAGADYVAGMTHQLQTGNLYGTGFLTLDTAQPITLDTTDLAFTFTAGPTFSWATSYKLLTGAQLTTEGADTTDDDVTWTATAWDEESPISFLTMPGIPGVTTLPAGKQYFRVANVGITTADLAGTTKLRVRLYVVQSDGTSYVQELLPAKPEVILTPNAPAAPVEFDYDLAADVTWASPEYRFVWVFELSTTCTSLVTMTARYSNASRGTWWQSTMQFPSASGTNDHRDLLFRDTADSHPPSAVGVQQRVLASDFTSSVAETWEDITGMSVDLKANETYLVDIRITAIEIAKLTQWCRLTLGESSVGMAAAVCLTHEIVVNQETDEGGTVPPELLVQKYVNGLGDSYYAETATPTDAFNTFTWRVWGTIVMDSADGTLSLRWWQHILADLLGTDTAIKALSSMRVEIVK